MLLRLRTVVAMALFLVAPSVSSAQSGRVTGQIVSGTNTPIAGARIIVPALGLSAVSNDQGAFSVSSVPVGTHRRSVYRIGYKPVTLDDVSVIEPEGASLTVKLELSATELQNVVVSASRHAEKLRTPQLPLPWWTGPRWPVALATRTIWCCDPHRDST